MLSAGAWKLNQPNMILFVLVDASGNGVTGLGGSFDLEISKAGGVFAPGQGVKGEIGNGWYRYVTDPSEADTVGPVAVYVTGGGVIDQNLEYVVEERTVGAVEFTYTVTSTQTGLPIENVYVIIATNGNGSNVIWTGFTDVFGVARDVVGNKPRLTSGTYYLFRSKTNFSFDDPDVEII